MSNLSRKRKKSSRLQEGEQACAMSLRIYPTLGQQHRLNNWLYVTQRFRNQAVMFCENRRVARTEWIKKHPALARDWIPEEFAGNDVSACSKWMTERLDEARVWAKLFGGLQFSKKNAVEVITQAFANLTVEEKKELGDVWLLTVPRTMLDQVLNDLHKTIQKAIKDRVNAKEEQSI